MRWTLAGLGFGLEAVALAVYFCGPLKKRLPLRGRKHMLMALFGGGALCLSVFALWDHDVTLLLGQGLLALLFGLLLKYGDRHAA